MLQRTLFQAVLFTVFMIGFACASLVNAGECVPAPCISDEGYAGGVPDGNFVSDAAAREVPATGEPVVETTRLGKEEDGTGSAIFSPFAGAKEPEKSPSALALLLANDGNVTAVAIALVLALILTLVGVAAFAYLRHRSNS